LGARRGIDVDRTVAVLDRIVATRGRSPEFIRCDNGPQLTANALRDRCRVSCAASADVEPGSPLQNAYVESVGSRIRDQLLAVATFLRSCTSASSSAAR
jgi:putative transposase